MVKVRKEVIRRNFNQAIMIDFQGGKIHAVDQFERQGGGGDRGIERDRRSRFPAQAAEGVQVVLAARSADRLRGWLRNLASWPWRYPWMSATRLRWSASLPKHSTAFGGLDLLFNNAGIGYGGAFVEGKTEEWRATINANLYGVLFCTRQAIPLLRGRPGAMIATVSSVGGRHGVAGFAVYNATKFTVVGLHDALRKELGPEGIRVSLIEPGAVYTNWGYNIPKEVMKARRNHSKPSSPRTLPTPWSMPSPSRPTSTRRRF